MIVKPVPHSPNKLHDLIALRLCIFLDVLATAKIKYADSCYYYCRKINCDDNHFPFSKMHLVMEIYMTNSTKTLYPKISIHAYSCKSIEI